MKRLNRNPEKFDVLELFSSMARKQGYDLRDSMAQDDFIARVKASLEESKQNDITIYGKRVEALFAYVAGALGKVSLLKQEDSGDLYFSGNKILAPDYRLTFQDGSQLFVEVKNCHLENPKDHFVIKKDYCGKLTEYGFLNNVNLKFAVYFSRWNLWTLLPISSFAEETDRYSIDFTSAMAKSEMSMLGDSMVGTTPNLELHLLADPAEASVVGKNGQANFTTRSIKIHCAGQEVEDEQEKRIAFYFMRFGRWIESETEAVVSDNKLLGMKFIFSPENPEPQDKQNFSIIGNLSSMVSSGFRELTEENGEVTSLSLGINPTHFRVLIPDDYKSDQLPIWRFILQPNASFEGVAENTNG